MTEPTDNDVRLGQAAMTAFDGELRARGLPPVLSYRWTVLGSRQEEADPERLQHVVVVNSPQGEIVGVVSIEPPKESGGHHRLRVFLSPRMVDGGAAMTVKDVLL